VRTVNKWGTSRKFYGLITFLLALIGVGGYATWIRVVEGLGVTALTDQVFWGAYVSAYIYFIGLSAGAFLLSSLIYVFGMKRYEAVGRNALLLAAVTMIVALLLLVIDIGNPERFWHVLVWRNPTSVLEWEVHFYLIYVVVLLAELWLSMRMDLIRLSKASIGVKQKLYSILTLGSESLTEASMIRDMKLLRVLGSVGIPIAVGVHGGTGAIFSVVKARPYWFSALVPVIFITSALVSGTALLVFLAYIQSKASGTKLPSELIRDLGRLVAFFLVIDLFFIFWEYLMGLYSLVPPHFETLLVIISGPFSWVFWVVQMLIGAVIPLYILLNRQLNRKELHVAGACLLITVGILGVRFNIVIPPLTLPVIEGLHAGGIYFPTLIEWLSVMGIVGVGALVYIIALRTLPIR